MEFYAQSTSAVISEREREGQTLTETDRQRQRHTDRHRERRRERFRCGIGETGRKLVRVNTGRGRVQRQYLVTTRGVHAA